MLKKIPWKNMIIVFTALLVVPVLAFAMTTAGNPLDKAADENANITITSDKISPDAASSATSVLTTGALGSLDGATSASGIVGDDHESDDEDEQYESSDDDDEEDDD